jgi:histidinol-phosphate aminotransferase
MSLQRWNVVADALRKTAVPFGVSGLAQAAATESLNHEPELLQRVEALVQERTRVERALAAQGWQIPRSEANFVWMELAAATSSFAEECARNGLIVRPFDGEGCRVTVAEQEANDILIRIASEWQKPKNGTNS